MVAQLPVKRVHHILSVSLLLAGFGLFAQERTVFNHSRTKPAEANADGSNSVHIRVESDLVQIPVTVMDRRNRFVTGLQKEHFRIFEDKVEQTITSFATEDAPLSVIIVFDASDSMGDKLQKSRQAVREFLKTANPEDEFALIQFNQHPDVVTGFTREIEEVQDRLSSIQASGSTALFDAMYMAVDDVMKQAHNARKALLVISDGGDNSSRRTQIEIENLVRESDVQIYTIGILGPIGSQAPMKDLLGSALLEEISKQTGGRNYMAGKLSDLPGIAVKIGTELHNQYVLGYVPSGPEKKGKYHRVKVKLLRPKGVPALRASWRAGYYAPADAPAD